MPQTGLGPVWGILIPFIGTSLGAAWVFFTKEAIKPAIQGMLAGFAAGVMTAASVWSLLIPAIEQSAFLGRLAFLPAAVGFAAGVCFLLALDHLSACLCPHVGLMLLAVTLHNIPEGMAVGVVLAGGIPEGAAVTMAEALALSAGIAIQNIPEGAIVSLPLRAKGTGRAKAFLYGVLSGAVEPAAAGLTLLASSCIALALPYLLSFAAGAMIDVVVEELIPEMSEASRPHMGIVSFSAGFVLMLALDVALG